MIISLIIVYFNLQMLEDFIKEFNLKHEKDLIAAIEKETPK